MAASLSRLFSSHTSNPYWGLACDPVLLPRFLIPARPAKSGASVTLGPALGARVDEDGRDSGEVGADAPATRIDDDDRQVGAEAQHVGGEGDVRPADHGAGGLARLVDAGQHFPRGGDRNGARVLRRGEGGDLAVHRVADLGGRVRRAELQEDVAGIGARFAREDRFARDARVSGAIRLARRWRREVLLLAAVEAIGEIGPLHRKARTVREVRTRAVLLDDVQVGCDQGQVLAVAIQGEIRMIIALLGPDRASSPDGPPAESQRRRRPAGRLPTVGSSGGPTWSGPPDRPSDTSRPDWRAGRPGSGFRSSPGMPLRPGRWLTV